MKKRPKGPRPPTALSDALGSFLEKSGLAARIEEASVVPEWEKLVGTGIAAVTVPLRVSRGTLFVTVRSSGWLMELKLMEGEIIRRLNAGRPRGKISKIRFLMAGE
jgi:predicted nucleic acid-binding Zn ribbon protein